jgi:hypothetical protein
MMNAFYKIPEFLRRHPVLSALAMPGLLILVLLAVWPTSYETNDDFFMNMIASGFYSGSPDEHLTYSHFLPGLVLKTLFNFYAGLNWYFWYLILFHWLGWSLIVYSWIRNSVHTYVLPALLLMLLLFETYFYFNLQFTTTAAIMACGGISLILSGQNQSLWSRSRIAGVAIVAVASMIRYEPALLIALLTAPLLLLTTSLKKWPGMILLIALLPAGIFASEWINKQYYARDPAWNTFFTELKTGNKFNDNPAFYETIINERKNLKAINGWTENDMLLFAVFFRNYAPVYNVEAYNRLHQAYSRFRAMPFRDYFYLFRRDFGKWPLLILAALAFLSAGNKYRWAMAAQFFLLALIAYYIYSDLLMKERVIYGALLCLTVSYLYILSAGNNAAQNQKYRMVMRSGLVLLLLATVWMSFSVSRKAMDRQIKQRRQLDKDLALLHEPEACYIIYGGCIPFEGIPPVENRFTWKNRAFHMLSLSAFHKSPLNMPTLRKFGQNSLETALGDARFKVITFADSAMIPLTPERLDRFSRQHLGCSLVKQGDVMIENNDKRIFWFSSCRPDSLLPNLQHKP